MQAKSTKQRDVYSMYPTGFRRTKDQGPGRCYPDQRRQSEPSGQRSQTKTAPWFPRPMIFHDLPCSKSRSVSTTNRRLSLAFFLDPNPPKSLLKIPMWRPEQQKLAWHGIIENHRNTNGADLAGIKFQLPTIHEECELRTPQSLCRKVASSGLSPWCTAQVIHWWLDTSVGWWNTHVYSDTASYTVVPSYTVVHRYAIITVVFKDKLIHKLMLSESRSGYKLAADLAHSRKLEPKPPIKMAWDRHEDFRLPAFF